MDLITIGLKILGILLIAYAVVVFFVNSTAKEFDSFMTTMFGGMMPKPSKVSILIQKIFNVALFILGIYLVW